MKDVLGALDRWSARGEDVALGTVVAVHRSAPRPPGAKMAISAGGEFAGAVSGGCVEGAVVQVAQDVLTGGRPRLVHYGIADDEARDVGLPCGGAIDVWVARYDTDDPAATAFADIARDDGRAALVTLVRGRAPGATLLVRADGATEGSLGDPCTDAETVALAEELMWSEHGALRELSGSDAVFVDVTAPAPRMIVFGAVDFAVALCRLARAAGWRPFVVDPRGFFATAQRFPEAEQVVAAWPREAVARLGGIDRATSVVVLSHDPKLDDAALALAVESEAAYIGALGSRSAQADRRARLLATGVAEELLERVSAPIGLDLGATSAEGTALSILAEIVAARNGRSGGRLRDAGGRIHAVGA
jgi:xanthine dehydrogenase accessory factor